MKTKTQRELAAEWYGSEERLKEKLDQATEDLYEEYEYLTSPTYAEFMEEKVAAREILHEELERRDACLPV